jgi:hypothetical protein
MMAIKEETFDVLSFPIILNKIFKARWFKRVLKGRKMMKGWNIRTNKEKNRNLLTYLLALCSSKNLVLLYEYAEPSLLFVSCPISSLSALVYHSHHLPAISI